MSIYSKTYSNRSNAVRAAKKHFGEAGFGVEKVEHDGKEVWMICDLQDASDWGVVVGPDETAALAADDKPVLALSEMDEKGDNGKCPHCGINHLENGWQSFAGMVEAHGKATPANMRKAYEGGMTNEYVCLACDGKWGKDIDPAEFAEKVVQVGNGLKIEKQREERNGIKRPSTGGKCRAIWDHCDALVAAGETPMPKAIKAWASANGHNENNAVIELYQWRKFMGIGKVA